MNDPIYETVVSTVDAKGRPHVAPMGVRYAAAMRAGPDATDAADAADVDEAAQDCSHGDVILMPFKPSTTLANIIATGHAVLNTLTDTRVFAGAVTGRRSWPLLAAEHVAGVRLGCALAHVELKLTDLRDHAERPVLRLARVFQATHAPFIGFNRAQAAVIEGAVLVSRLHMLPAAKVDAEMRYLQIAIDKTAAAPELEAWSWLLEAVARYRAGAPGQGPPGRAARP